MVISQGEKKEAAEPVYERDVTVSPPLPALGVFCTGCAKKHPISHNVVIGWNRSRVCPPCLERLIYQASLALNGELHVVKP